MIRPNDFSLVVQKHLKRCFPSQSKRPGVGGFRKKEQGW